MMRAPELKLFAANHNVSFPPFNCLLLLSLSFCPFLFLYVCLSVVCVLHLFRCVVNIFASLPLSLRLCHYSYQHCILIIIRVLTARHLT
jgi:hypothetical protein